jgi:ABC-type uncharacterized transport system permease subunit
VLAREIGRRRACCWSASRRAASTSAPSNSSTASCAPARAGCAILLVSVSELDEILALADRVLVMCGGRITGELPIEACSEARIGLLMAGQRAHGGRGRRTRMSGSDNLPRWADLVLLPLVNLADGALVAGLVVAWSARARCRSCPCWCTAPSARPAASRTRCTTPPASSSPGLAVAVAAQGGLFNIGAEGPGHAGWPGHRLVAVRWAAAAGLGAAAADAAGGAAFGMAWAAVPAWLQAYRGSHVVITTIMFNFIASALLVYLLVNVLKRAGQHVGGDGASAPAHLPGVHEVARRPSASMAFVAAEPQLRHRAACAAGVYCSCGAAARATACARSAPAPAPRATPASGRSRQVIFSRCAMSGALAGMVGMNEIAGVNGKLLLDFVGGAGFTGIAVSR